VNSNAGADVKVHEVKETKDEKNKASGEKGLDFVGRSGGKLRPIRGSGRMNGKYR